MVIMMSRYIIFSSYAVKGAAGNTDLTVQLPKSGCILRNTGCYFSAGALTTYVYVGSGGTPVDFLGGHTSSALVVSFEECLLVPSTTALLRAYITVAATIKVTWTFEIPD